MRQKIEEELHGLPENFIVLTIVDSEKSENVNMALLDYLVNVRNLKGNYINVTRPFVSITQLLRTNSINPDQLFFIDCISKDLNSEKDASNCVYIDSPQHLTDISIAVQELLNQKHGKFIVIDSINTLSIYNDRDRLMKFMHFLTGKIRVHELKGVMISVNKGADTSLISEMAQFCDKIVDLSD